LSTVARLPAPLRDPVERFDRTVDRWFTALRGNPTADRVFYIASEAADYSKAWHVIGVTMALVSPSRRRDSLRLAVALGVESALVNGLLKSAIPRERPTLLDDAAYEVRRPRTKSFPSGHASSACLTATLLSEAVPRLKPAWWSLAAVVSASRIHNRMHHPSDVVAGAALGAAMGRTVQRFWPLRAR
jgi:undecaprenyl-diphosphatase